MQPEMKTDPVLKWNSIGQTLRKNSYYVVVFAAFLAGMFYGAFLVGKIDESTAGLLGMLTDEYLASRISQSIWQTFISSLVSSVPYLILLFLLGFLSIGQPLIVVAPVFRGIGLGVTMGGLYLDYGMQGVLYCAVLIMPITLLVTFVLISASRNALKMANLFLSPVLREERAGASADALRIYCIKFLVFALVLLGASLLDALLNFLFSSLFALQ